MRIVIPCLCVIAASCNQVPPEQEALVNYVERRVELPKGAGNLQCYERHYALLGRETLKRYFEGVADPPPRVLIGKYIRGQDRQPGVYMKASESDLPEISDAGCSVLTVFHIPGDTHRDGLKASCSANIAGVTPDEINPPVTC